MNQYFFALGTNHTLSKIDIVNTLLKKEADFEIIEASEEVLIISTDSRLEAKELINELGSAAKIGEIIKTTKEEKLKNEIEEIVGGKKFGISVYGSGGKLREVDKIFRGMRGIGGIRGNDRILSTVAVDKNKLLTDGIEAVVCVGSKGIYLGKTLAIQDYEGYSLRDYGRPARDDRSGMIPPKLAKMMINLAGKSKDDLILDPFCGSGTILQELILLDYKNIIGSDVEDKAVSDSQENIDWFLEKYQLDKKIFNIKIFKSDARTLSSKISYKSVDGIITEPFLGSSRIKSFGLEKIKREVQILEQLYLAGFKEFKKILKDSGVMVIIFPVFRFKNQFFKLEILDKIEEIGFKQKDFIKGKIKGKELLKLHITDRNSVIYFRSGQTVSREIFYF